MHHMFYINTSTPRESIASNTSLASEISTTTINSFESAAGPICDFTTSHQTQKPTSQTLVGNSHGVKSIAKWSKIALPVILGSNLQSH